jgi:4-hydroxy-3-methylbut-2-en-1-yl diphosphate reductase
LFQFLLVGTVGHGRGEDFFREDVALRVCDRHEVWIGEARFVGWFHARFRSCFSFEGEINLHDQLAVFDAADIAHAHDVDLGNQGCVGRFVRIVEFDKAAKVRAGGDCRAATIIHRKFFSFFVRIDDFRDRVAHGFETRAEVGFQSFERGAAAKGKQGDKNERKQVFHTGKNRPCLCHWQSFWVDFQRATRYITAMEKRPLTILLSAPRGFCAGVDRAIQIVEKAIEKYGAPVYVRHEIVHNKFVVDGLREKGAVFVEELGEIPDDGRPVIFSAHGVAKAVPAEAKTREMFFIDATCPLVSKVHKEAEKHHEMGRQIILIGHAGHPEVIGTMGQLPADAVVLVETVEDVAGIVVANQNNLAFCTQTTLSVDDTADVVAALKQRFPAIVGPGKEDICYATTNRQEAVKAIAPRCDALMVIGAPNSSNSNRLVEVGVAYGCDKAILVQRAAEIDWKWFDSINTLGLTAGASAPDVLIEEVIAAARERFDVMLEEVAITKENVVFNIPRILRDAEEKVA